MFSKKLVLFLSCFSSMISCVDDIDFSQIEDYYTVQEITSSLTYFTITPIQFFNQAGVQETERTDITDFLVASVKNFRLPLLFFE